MIRAFPFLAALLSAASSLSVAAIAEPPPPAAPSPQAMPYPNSTERESASGLASGKRMHKPYTLTTEAQTISAVAVAWRTHIHPNMAGVASDPEEGGEVTAAKTTTKPHVGDMTVTKRTDVSSPKMMSAAEAGTDQPPPSGTATITVARGACASGQHIKEATIVVRNSTYQLQDVDVTGCTANADGTDTCTLDYAAFGG